MMDIKEINNLITEQQLIDETFIADNISDGYHTFGQLYFQRMMLFATLVNLFPELSWKTKRHEDGELCFGGGWFLVTIDTPQGAYGYHYEEKYWDYFNCPEIKKAKHWDGYTEENVDRLFTLIDVKSWYGMIIKDRESINLEQFKTCGRCIHDGESGDISGSSCYFCKRNPDDHRIDWFESKRGENNG